MRMLTSVLFVIWFYSAMAFFGLLYAPLTLLNDKYIWHSMRGWSKTTLFGLRWICGIQVKFEGLEHVPKGPALLAAKHQATLDTLLPVLFVSEPTFIVKQELTKMPIFGFYMKRMIPVDRGAHAKALKDMLRASRQVIAKGRQIVIFPEGTRQELGAPTDYKPGVAAMYRDFGLPCTPIALNTGMVWRPSGIMRSPGTVTLKFLPAIPAGLSRDDFMRELETRIESESQALLPPHLRRVAA